MEYNEKLLIYKLINAKPHIKHSHRWLTVLHLLSSQSLLLTSAKVKKLEPH